MMLLGSVSAIGLELGEAHWRAVQLECGPIKARLIGSARGAMEGSGDRADAVATAVESAIDALGVESGWRLGVVVARPLVHVKRILVPRMPRIQLQRQLEAESASFLPMGRIAMRIDMHSRYRHAPWKREMEVVVAAMPDDLVEAITRTVQRRGLSLGSIDIVASGLRFLCPRQAHGAIVLHSPGIEWAEYDRRGVRTSRYFPGHPDTEARCNGAQQADGLPPELRSTIEDVGPIVVLGADEAVERFKEATPAGWSDDQRDAAPRLRIQDLERSELVPACGGAVLGMGAAHWFDLRPDRLRQISNRRNRRRTLGLALAALLAAAFYATTVQWILREEVAWLERNVERSAAEAESVLGMRDAALERIRRAGTLGRLERAQPRWTAVLAELARVVPEAAHLTELRQREETLVLEGLAMTASELVGALRRSPLFASVRLAGPVTREDTPEGERERFEVEVVLAGDER